MKEISKVVGAVVEDARGFAALEGEWEDLYGHCPRATPFQSWAWLYSWWEHYGEGYELRLITVRNDEGLLVGLLPLMLERRGGVGRLLFVGTGLSDYLDVIVREGWEDIVFKTGGRVLAGIRSWHVVDLQQLRPDALCWGILQEWDGSHICVWQDSCPVVEAKPWDELLRSLSAKQRRNARRTLRQAATDGLHSKIADVTDTEQAAQRLIELHREAWQKRNIGPEHLTQRFAVFMTAAANRMASRELGSISEYWQDGEVLISTFLVFRRDFCGAYLVGVSQKALQRYDQWSPLFIWDAVDIARSKNKRYLDLLRGEETYKVRWSSRIIPTHRLVLGQHWATWMPYAGYHILRSKARRYARSESVPQWIKGVIGKYRTLRYGVDRCVNKIRGRL